MLQGDFGRSLQYRQDVTTVIADRLPVTLGLVVMAGTMIAVAGLLGGTVAALYRGRAPDRLVLIGLTVLGAIPSFVGSIVLIAVFAVQLGWFPSFGSGEGFFDTVYHLVLPSTALAIVFTVLVAKVTRSAMVEQLDREHVEVATSRGLRTARSSGGTCSAMRCGRSSLSAASSSPDCSWPAPSSNPHSGLPESARSSCNRSIASTFPWSRRSCCWW